MFQNNLKIAWRTLRKNKMYTAITLLGLSIGIASALLIFRILNYELSFNENFTNYDRIVRIVSVETNADGSTDHHVCMPVPAMDVIKNEVAEFELTAPIREVWSTLIVPNPNGGNPLKKLGMEDSEQAFFATNEFCQLLDLTWLSGNETTALSSPDAIILTRKMAEKCFGNWEQATGQTLLVDNIIPVKVTGVVENLPSNCDFNFPYLISYPVVEANEDYFFYNSTQWGSCSSNDQLFALLHKNVDIEEANVSLAPIGQEHYQGNNRNETRKHYAQPISDLHYNEDLSNSGTHRTSMTRLKILGAIGILILILACFNFINLSTAQSSLRAKEVGVRKTLGGLQSQLITQFLTETGLLVFCSAAIGIFIAYASLPLLAHVSNVPNELAFLNKIELWVCLASILITVTILAGLYPSLTLARFKPVNALKNNVEKGLFKGVWIRRSLVILQFTIAQALVIAAVITLLQLDFIQKQDLGFQKDLIYTFPIGTDSTSVARQDALKSKLLQLPTVKQVSLSTDQPLSGNTWATSFRYKSRPENEDFSLTIKMADADYGETYGIRMIEGNWYAPSDTMRHGVVNETLLRKLGINNSKEIIGENIVIGRDDAIKVVGVMEDFHTHSFHREFRPLMLTTLKSFYGEVGVNIRPDRIKGTVHKVQAVFDEVYPEQVFDGSFLDERIASQYESDNRLAATCKGFGFLAILISCLGLFGLATHSAAQRVKEIGIRKVLGSSIMGIVSLLSKDFLKLVFVALFLAAPIAWWLMSSWLENFVFRIDIPWWVFVVTGIAAIAIAFFTVGIQSIRAALANPVESLKSE